MSEEPDPVIRLCHNNNTCSKTFTYVPHPKAIEAGLADKVDAMASVAARWTRGRDGDGRLVHYCERCTREGTTSG